MRDQETLEQLSKWEEVAFGEYNSKFEERFCHGNELINIYFGSSVVKFNYVLESGQHITDTKTIESWLDFYNKFRPRVGAVRNREGETIALRG